MKYSHWDLMSKRMSGGEVLSLTMGFPCQELRWGRKLSFVPFCTLGSYHHEQLIFGTIFSTYTDTNMLLWSLLTFIYIILCLMVPE